MKHDEECLAIRNGVVRKANALIQKSRFSLTTQQQKVILYLISRISPQDKDMGNIRKWRRNFDALDRKAIYKY